MAFSLTLAVAAGGAIGAVARFWVTSAIGRAIGHGFPWGTLAVNVVGSLAMGMLVTVMALAWSPPQHIRAMLTVGLLGAFTTFSTFSLDVVVLAERGAWVAAALYVLGSVVLCVAGLFAGMWAMRTLLT